MADSKTLDELSDALGHAEKTIARLQEENSRLRYGIFFDEGVTALEHAVAGAIKEALPKRVPNPDWLAISRAAIRAIRAYDFSRTEK